MNIEEAIELLRISFLDDTVEPYLWKDEALINYLNMAEAEACRRANLLIDSQTPTVCNINVIANQQRYDLHDSIIYVLSARNDTANYSMYQTTKYELDVYYSHWSLDTSDNPTWFFIDDSNFINIVPIPNSDFTMKMTVSRLPLVSDKSSSDEFEIPEKYQRDLLYYAAFLALKFKDVVAKTKGKDANDYLAIFESKFGRRPTAKEEMKKKRIPRKTMMRPMTKYFGMP